jgi:hypothetical protein
MGALTPACLLSHPSRPFPLLMHSHFAPAEWVSVSLLSLFSQFETARACEASRRASEREGALKGNDEFSHQAICILDCLFSHGDAF